MAWTVALSLCWMLIHTNGAALDQQILSTVAFAESVEEVFQLTAPEGSAVLSGPIGRPCYRSSKWYDPVECLTAEANKTLNTWVTDQPGGYYYANWASCQSEGQTCSLPLNTTNSNAVPDHAICFNGSIPSTMLTLSPADIVGDAQRVLNEARAYKGSVIIKNTGHDWKGRSSTPSDIREVTVLWTHPLKSPQVPIIYEQSFTPENCSIREPEEVFHFGPGETWAGAYEYAEHSNRSVVGGTCGSVGIAGWLHGGGHSPLTPVHGMGADNVRQIEIVTPDGEIQTANECHNPDLFFAVRGGGGNTFGIVTNITYKALPKFAEFTVKLPKLNSSDVAKLFDIFTSKALLWAANGWGGYIKIPTEIDLVNSNSSFTIKTAASDMAEVIVFLKNRNISYDLLTRESWYDYYQHNLAPPAAHPAGSSAAVASRLVPPAAFEAGRQTLTNILYDMYHVQNVTTWLMLVTPTKFAHTSTSALHPSWSTAIWSVRIHKLWDQFYNSAPAANRQYFELVHHALQPLRNMTPGMGISLNEADIWEPDYANGFWGSSNYDKLLKIKRAFDPSNILSNWQAVGWEPGLERYKCYPKP